MTRKEDVQPNLNEIVDFRQLNEIKPSLDLLGRLKQEVRIPEGAPVWWSTDYSPDPREYLPYSSFKRRLVNMGICTVSRSESFISGHRPYDETYQKDIRLYTHHVVPMSVLPLEIDGNTLQFFVTARPYHPKELKNHGKTPGFVYKPIKELRGNLREGNPLLLPRHFFPHIRGLFAGVRGNNLFWFPFNINSEEDYHKLQSALSRGGNNFLGVDSQGDLRTYEDAYEELSGLHIIDSRTPHWFDFPTKQVSPDELIDTKDTDPGVYTYYPVRISNVKHTLPVVVTNRTHSASTVRKLSAVGIFARTWNKRGGIWRFKDRDVALQVSAKLSEELEVPVDAVLFRPQKGRPHYERVAA